MLMMMMMINQLVINRQTANRKMTLQAYKLEEIGDLKHSPRIMLPPDALTKKRVWGFCPPPKAAGTPFFKLKIRR